MTVYLVTAARHWQGFSTDEKPTTDVTEGSTFHAVDTGEEWVFHAEMWVLDLRRINAIKLAGL